MESAAQTDLCFGTPGSPVQCPVCLDDVRIVPPSGGRSDRDAVIEVATMRYDDNGSFKRNESLITWLRCLKGFGSSQKMRLLRLWTVPLDQNGLLHDFVSENRL